MRGAGHRGISGHHPSKMGVKGQRGPEGRGEAGVHLEEDPISYSERARKRRREWWCCLGKGRDLRGQLAGGKRSTKSCQELMRL